MVGGSASRRIGDAKAEGEAVGISANRRPSVERRGRRLATQWSGAGAGGSEAVVASAWRHRRIAVTRARSLGSGSGKVANEVNWNEVRKCLYAAVSVLY